MNLWTTTEAAATLGVTTQTIRNWVAKGKLEPAARLPGVTGALLFDREDVERIQRERAA